MSWFWTLICRTYGWSPILRSYYIFRVWDLRRGWSGNMRSGITQGGPRARARRRAHNVYLCLSRMAEVFIPDPVGIAIWTKEPELEPIPQRNRLQEWSRLNPKRTPSALIRQGRAICVHRFSVATSCRRQNWHQR